MKITVDPDFEYLRPGEEVNLTNCDKEAIHLIARVQNGSWTLVLEQVEGSAELQPLQVSKNIDEISEYSPEAFLNLELYELLTPRIAEAVGYVVSTGTSEPEQLNEVNFPWSSERYFDLSVYRSESHIVLEWTAASQAHPNLVVPFLELASTRRSTDQLAQMATDLVKEALDCDQVVLYRFDDTFNGEAIAEAKNESCPSYLQRWFPSSDVPLPARVVMVKRPVGVTIDNLDEGVDLVSKDGAQHAVDFSRSVYRFTSRMCSQYYRNMGVRGRVVVSIMYQSRLWGLFACWDYETALNPGILLRQELDSFANRFIESYQKLKRVADQNLISDVKKRHSFLLNQLIESENLSDGIASLEGLSDTLPADGAALVLPDSITTSGEAPPETFIFELVEWLVSHHSTAKVFSHRNLESVFPAADQHRDTASGILALRLGRKRSSYLIWFRRELHLEIPWAGKPQKLADPTDPDQRLLPRSSFDVWLDESQGYAAQWQEYELELAERFRDELLIVLNELASEELLSVAEQRQVIADLRQERRKLIAANDLLKLTEQAMNRTGVAEYWIDAENGQIIRASDEACRMLGYPSREILNLSFWDLDAKFSGPSFAALVGKLERLGWLRFESEHAHRSGQPIPVEVTLTFHERSSDQARSLVMFTTDITKRKEVENELILSRQVAEDANRAKSTFLATMSHEIRTPLNGIVGTIDMLRHSPLQLEQQELITTAIESADMLQRVIDDILDFSKIEAGKLELERIPVDLEHELDSLTSSLKMTATANRVELQTFVDPKLPDVLGDPVRLKQILFNLVGNAIKFSKGDDQKTGRVRVSVLVEELQPETVTVEMRVIDNGIGMSQEVQQRLFQAFTQGEQSITREFGGSGLGLVITSRLVDLMNGRIDVSSERGIGSEFSIKLELPVYAIQSQKDHLDGVDVLYINPTDTELENFLRAYVEDLKGSFEVVEVQTLADRLSKRAGTSRGKGVVILDSAFAKHNPYVLDAFLQLSSETQPFPVIIIERFNNEIGRLDRCLVVDGQGMRRRSLLNTIAAALSHDPYFDEQGFESEFDLISSNEIVRERAEGEHRLLLLVDDNETNLKVISRQLRVLGYWADTASDGEEALKAWRNNRYDAILTDCHMPNMDGYELSRTIRASGSETSQIPIIAITADALKGTAAACQEAGMNAYLTKPMQLKDIQRTLDQQLKGSSVGISQTGTDELEGVVTETDHEQIDRAALAKIIGTEDPDVLREFYLDFVKSSELTLTDLVHARSSNDLSTLSRLGHKLKSSARTVGANALADYCLAVEQLAGLEDGIVKFDSLYPQVTREFEAVKAWISNSDS